MTKKIVKKPKVKILKKVGRPSSMPLFWTDLIRAAGGVDRLGVEIGKSARQIRRIANGYCPVTPSCRIALALAAEKHGMLKALQRWEDGAEK